MTQKELRSKTISQNQLLRLGWTRGMIRRFLPEPMLVENPLKFSTPMKLFKIADVEAVTASEAFQREMAKRGPHRSAHQDMEPSPQILMESYTEKILVEKISDSRLQQEAVMLNKRMYDSKDYFFGDENVKVLDGNLMDKFKVNFIRHNLTNYEALKSEIKGKRCAEMIRKYLKIAVIQKIGETYPDVMSECQRQIACLGGKR